MVLSCCASRLAQPSLFGDLLHGRDRHDRRARPASARSPSPSRRRAGRSSATPVANDEASDAISTEPMSAVPSDEPRFWKTPCRPPTSLDSVSLTLDMLTLPSWVASRPSAAPARNIPTPNGTALQFEVDRTEQQYRAQHEHHLSRAHDATRRPARGEARADDREEDERDRERKDPDARLECVEAECHLQVHGHHEEQSGGHCVLGAQHREAAAQRRDAEQLDMHERLAAGVDERELPTHEDVEQDRADHDEPRRERDAERRDRRRR